MTRHENILALATLGEDEKNFVHFFRHISSDYLPKLPKSPETSRFWQTFSWKLLGVFDMGHFGRCYSTLNASSLSSRARRRNLLETVEYFIHYGVCRNLHVAARTSNWLQSFRLKSKRSPGKQIPRKLILAYETKMSPRSHSLRSTRMQGEMLDRSITVA